MNLPARTPIPAEFGGQPQPSSGDGAVDWSTRPRDHATEKQVKFLKDLVSTRELPAEAREAFETKIAAAERGDWLNGVPYSRVSGWIDRLKALPRKAGAARAGRFPVRFERMELDGGKTMELGFVDVNGREVPQGKYALNVADLGWVNELAFFNLYVARGDDGPFYSLKMYVSDDLTKMSAENQREVLGRIAADPAAASALYGAHKTRCGICNRKLTNDVSRARGIGPVCADRMGW